MAISMKPFEHAEICDDNMIGKVNKLIKQLI